MDLTINATDFKRALSVVLAAIDKRSPRPLLAHVRVTASDGTLVLEGTDLATAARAALPAVVAAPGVCLVPLAALIAAAKGKGDVRLEAVGGRARLTQGAHVAETEGLDLADYPALAFGAADGAVSVTLAAAQWLDILDTVEHAVSTDDTRPDRACLNVEADGSTMYVTATDGHRLAHTRQPCAVTLPNTLLARRALPALRALCKRVIADGTEQSVTLHVPESDTLRVTNCRNDMSIRRVDARFPPWRQALPELGPDDAALRVDAAELSAALRRLEPHAKGTGVTIEASAEDGAIVIVSEHPDRGTASARVPCSGSAPRIGLNPRYLAEAVEAIGGKGRVAIRVRSALDPVTIISALPTGAVAVIMPVRI